MNPQKNNDGRAQVSGLSGGALSAFPARLKLFAGESMGGTYLAPIWHLSTSAIRPGALVVEHPEKLKR